MQKDENNRETGARKLPARTGADASDEFSQDAATNRKPRDGIGNTEPLTDANEKTRHSDGQNPSVTEVTKTVRKTTVYRTGTKP